jgi:alcohol dehydrogenase class IV
MAWASLLGGLALANAGLGAVHGFAAPIGGMFPAPHGAVCAALLPHVMDVNVRALRARAPADEHAAEKLARYDEVARLISGRPHAGAQDGVAWVAALCEKLEIPPLRSYGVAPADLPMLVEKAALSSSMKGNPIVLSVEELGEIVMRAL